MNTAREKGLILQTGTTPVLSEVHSWFMDFCSDSLQSSLGNHLLIVSPPENLLLYII